MGKAEEQGLISLEDLALHILSNTSLMAAKASDNLQDINVKGKLL